MFGVIKRKIFVIVGLFVILLSSILNIFTSSSVSASTAVYEQTYVELTDINRIDNELHVTLKDELLVRNMTYEYTHYVNNELESDLIIVEPKQLSTTEYMIELPADTVGVKVWKIMHQVEDDYYKNKYTTGPNSIGDLSSVKKKNYITVTSDDLVSYEYSTQNFELPWYMWSPVGIQLSIGDYLFREEKSASYTWYFNIDKEIDSIIDVNITYATFEYSEIFWGAIESKHDYQTHGPMKVKASDEVFDYETYIKYTEETCGIDFAGGTCNNLLKEKGEDYFKKPAIGASTYADADGNTYDWYVQVTLNDLLEENNVLWGAYENKEYLQEVTLLNISYYFEGQEYFDVNVLDEDTGEANIIPDPSPIDRLAKAIDDIYEWIQKAVDWLKDNWWKALIGIIAIVSLVLLVIKYGIKLIMKLVWEILKWTIFLPITLIYISVKKNRANKKRKKQLQKDMEEIEASKNKAANKKKGKKS